MIGSYKFDIKGIHEAIAKMDFTTRKVNDSANGALREGGEVYRNEIERNTKTGPGRGGVHAKDNVIKSNVSSKGAYKSIRIGYAPNVSWRMWFVEEGTYSKGNPKGISPKRIVEISKKSKDYAVEDIIADFIAQVINSI